METSRTGRALDFLAPGKNISAASPLHSTDYRVVGGTSCAAASVAGLSALLIQFVLKIADQKKLPCSPSVNELVHTQSVIRMVLQKISESLYNIDCGYGCLDPSIIFNDKEKLLQFLYEEIHLREQ